VAVGRSAPTTEAGAGSGPTVSNERRREGGERGSVLPGPATSVRAHRPCFRAFLALRALPAAVRGPCHLARSIRLASARAPTVVITGLGLLMGSVPCWGTRRPIGSTNRPRTGTENMQRNAPGSGADRARPRGLSWGDDADHPRRLSYAPDAFRATRAPCSAARWRVRAAP
jgi:hypothetical protein